MPFYSRVDHAGTNGQSNFAFSFPYLSEDHIRMFVDSVETTLFTFLNSATVTLDTPLSGAHTVRVQRTTPIDAPIVDFESGSVLGESELDISTLQNLYAIQEAYDDANESFSIALLQDTSDGIWDAESIRIKNVATPTAANDAVTKTYADDNLAVALAAAAAALVSEQTASAASTNANTASNNANTASTNANTASNNANTANTSAWIANTNAWTTATNANTAANNANTAFVNANTAANNANTANTNAWAAVANVAQNTAAVGAIQFNNGVAFGGSVNLVWDNVNARLGIGNTAPQHLLSVSGNAFFLSDMTLRTGIRDATGTLGNRGSILTSNTTASVWQNSSANGQLMIGNTVSSGFDLATLTAGTGVSVTNLKGAITVAASGTGITNTAAEGAIQFNNAGAFAATANLVWDNTNVGLGIGNSAPKHLLSVSGNAFFLSDMTLRTGIRDATGTLGNQGSILTSNTTASVWKNSSANGQLLIGNTVSSGFDLATLTAGTGVSVTNLKGAITVAASGTGIANTAAVGAIQFNNAGAFAATANLVWDNTDTRLGIGNSAPKHLLSVSGNAFFLSDMTLRTGIRDATGTLGNQGSILTSNTTASVWQNSSANGQLLIGNTVSSGFDLATLTAGTGVSVTNLKGAITVAASGTGIANTAAEGAIQFNNAGAFAATANLVWDNTNVGLGIGNTAPKHLLSVSGNAFFLSDMTLRTGIRDATGTLGNPGSILTSNTTASVWKNSSANGQLMIGNTVSSGFDLATLTAGTNITIDNLKGQITINSLGGFGFGDIQVAGQSSLVSDQANDVLTVVAGAGIQITTDAGTDTLTITASGSSSTDQYARDTANGAFGHANGAYAQANIATTNADAAFAQANAGFTLATTANTVANSAYAQANIATTNADAAFAQANAGFTLATTANTVANSAYAQANIATTNADAAFAWANTANVTGQAAFDKANSAIYTAAQIRANISNAYPVYYDVTTGVVSFVPATANGQTLIGNTVSGTFDVSLIAQTAPVIVVNDKGSITLSHASTAVIAGTYGGSNRVIGYTVDAFGHLTAASNVAIDLLPASAISSGILSVARGGTGQDATGVANGQILIGNTVNSGFDLATVAQSAPVIVSVDKGSITLSHARSGVTAGTLGGSNRVIGYTVDANGHLTTTSNVAIDQLPAEAITTGTLLQGRGGTGFTGATANGQLLIGNTVSGGFDLAALTAGTNITIDNLKGQITITSAGGGGVGFATIAVSGQSDVVAEIAADTLTLVAGESMVITTNAGTDTITLAAQDAFARTQANNGYSHANGAFTAANTATSVGTHSLWIPAWSMYPVATNGASPANGVFETVTNDIMFKTLDYDTTTAEKAQFNIKMGNSWNLGTMTARAVWSHGTTSVNFGVTWSFRGVSLSDNEAGDAAFGSTIEVSDTGGTANNIYVSPLSGLITIAGTPLDNDWLVIEVGRAIANASDTMAIDARLHGIELFYTSDAGTDL